VEVGEVAQVVGKDGEENDLRASAPRGHFLTRNVLSSNPSLSNMLSNSIKNE